jgi:hypothetical protein
MTPQRTDSAAWLPGATDAVGREASASVLVSVVVPVYNVEAYIGKCIQSIVDQDHTNIELILVDDGSPDGSGGICDAYARSDARIQVVHQRNSGVSAARNAGMAVAQGKYVMFVDADDWLAPDCVTYLLQVALQTGSDMGMSSNHFTTLDDRQTEAEAVTTWTAEAATAALLFPKVTVGCWNKIYRRDFLDQHELRFRTELFSSEGLRFITDASQRANHVGVGRRKVYWYRLDNPQSATTKPNTRIGTGGLDALRSIKSHLVITTPPVQTAFEHMLLSHYFFLICSIVTTGSQDTNAELLTQAIRRLRKCGFHLLGQDIPAKRKLVIFAECLYPQLVAQMRQRRLTYRLTHTNA